PTSGPSSPASGRGRLPKRICVCALLQIIWIVEICIRIRDTLRHRLQHRNGRESDRMRRDTSPYFYDSFTRQQWARFDAGSYRLAPAALTLLKGVNEPMPISEVEEVIGPLCRL